MAYCVLKCVFWIASVTFGLFVSDVLAQEQCSLDSPLTINADADVKFSVITSLRASKGDKCGEVSVTALQNLGVMQWVVNKMNYENFTGDVKIGKIDLL